MVHSFCGPHPKRGRRRNHLGSGRDKAVRPHAGQADDPFRGPIARKAAGRSDGSCRPSSHADFNHGRQAVRPRSRTVRQSRLSSILLCSASSYGTDILVLPRSCRFRIRCRSCSTYIRALQESELRRSVRLFRPAAVASGLHGDRNVRHRPPLGLLWSTLGGGLSEARPRGSSDGGLRRIIDAMGASAALRLHRTALRTNPGSKVLPAERSS